MWGLQENVNVQQVKQNTDMDSHEEKLHDVIIKSKIEDTKAVMKAKAREIEASKLERMQVSARTRTRTHEHTPRTHARTPAHTHTHTRTHIQS